jgi:hypothetical protein
VTQEGPPKTFEVPPGGADSAGLEDYVVETTAGERIGTVVASVEQGGGRWLVVETGLPPMKRDRRAVPWNEIEEVDHDALVVRIAAAAARSLERLSESGREDDASASRVTDLPGAPSYVPTGDVAGPTDRSLTLIGALALFAIGLLALLAIVAVLSRHGRDTPYLIALVIPATLLAGSAILGYRLWRDPYSR